jgi:hypothetical protein
MGDERGDDRRKSSADNDTDRELHDIAAADKVFEFFKNFHFRFLLTTILKDK